MVLLTHILIACASIGYTTYLFFAPSSSKFPIAYVFIALTIASGAFLIFKSQSHMVQACLSGVVYLGFVCTALVAARGKLASENARNR